ncbi:amidohydrolase/deacetylase family metallohydrolase [Adhaeribacter aquaticus]|uniref:amidohydrolase/deacetylase family metallohydrolase n=1 Tax=Adhaeribacter aquaticus TaxID=299567 RepID=UPI0004024037|nr:amidohydrolase/deacetylase family metallohydrolase [Adhaeribacter aquaticus]
MRRIFSLLFLLICLGVITVQGQTYSIVIKGGHVIDPKNNLNGLMDVAITDNKIAAVAKNIDEKLGKQVVNAKGLYVMPGLLDIHSHNFWGTNMDQTYMNGPNALPPDGFTFRNGVTTVVDAGSPGWRTFPDYKKQTIDASKTRVLAFLNISGEGMRGGNYEQNTNDMDAKLSANVARQYRNHIVGFKVAHFEGPEWTPVDRAVEAGKLAGGLPVMIDFGGSNPPLSIEELFFKHLRPGDIFTHAYGQLASREAIVDTKTNKVKPFVWEAQKRGIVFDVGYGGISFAFSQALPAVKQGFYPTTISTDIHTGSMNDAMKDMLTTMSKFLAMGMDLQNVIKASTWVPAQVIKHEELGHLSVGAVADVAILGMRKGNFGLFDYTGYRIETDKKLECEMTLREGKVVYNLNGIISPMVLPRTASGSGSNNQAAAHTH